MSRPAIRKARVIEMLLAGASPREIMAATGCHRSSVNDYRGDLGLQPHSKGGRPRKSA